jgi:hypothetical protein
MGHRTLIVAANGRVASRVAAKLSAAGDAPDVLVRDAAKAQRVLVDDRGRPTYRDLFVGELANDETMRRAMLLRSLPSEAARPRRISRSTSSTPLSRLHSATSSNCRPR